MFKRFLLSSPLLVCALVAQPLAKFSQGGLAVVVSSADPSVLDIQTSSYITATVHTSKAETVQFSITLHYQGANGPAVARASVPRLPDALPLSPTASHATAEEAWTPFTFYVPGNCKFLAVEIEERTKPARFTIE